MRDSVPAALAGLGRPGLLPVVFADARYGAVLENWLRHAARAGVAETLVVALDDATEAACRGHPGLGVVGLRHDGTMASLWALRLRLFATLAREGVAFIHSDADAVWLADPRPSLAESPGELVFSLGAVWPQAAHADWGFVLCCGLVAARPAPAVSAFLDGLAAEAEGGQPNDQVLLNHRLLAAGTTWDWSGVPRRERPFRDTVLADPAGPLPGACAALALRLWALPQAWVPRLPERLPESMVLHPLSPKEPEAKAVLLRGLGAWDGGRRRHPGCLRAVDWAAPRPRLSRAPGAAGRRGASGPCGTVRQDLSRAGRGRAGEAVLALPGGRPRPHPRPSGGGASRFGRALGAASIGAGEVVPLFLPHHADAAPALLGAMMTRVVPPAQAFANGAPAVARGPRRGPGEDGRVHRALPAQ